MVQHLDEFSPVQINPALEKMPLGLKILQCLVIIFMAVNLNRGYRLNRATIYSGLFRRRRKNVSRLNSFWPQSHPNVSVSYNWQTGRQNPNRPRPTDPNRNRLLSTPGGRFSQESMLNFHDDLK